MTQYRKLDGTPVENSAAYVKAYMQQYPEAILSVGSDSQNIGGHSLYATVIAFRHPGKGVHYILSFRGAFIHRRSRGCGVITPGLMTWPMLWQEAASAQLNSKRSTMFTILS